MPSRLPSKDATLQCKVPLDSLGRYAGATLETEFCDENSSPYWLSSGRAAFVILWGWAVVRS
jgi:hypothetical protein